MAGQSDSTITLELTDGTSQDDPRLDDFIEQLRTLKAALRETERLVLNQTPSLYFRVKRLQKNSPSIVTLEAVSDSVDRPVTPRFASHVVKRFAANLSSIGNRRKLPGRIDFVALESYRALAIPAAKNHLQVRIQVGGNSVLIDDNFRRTIDDIAGEDEISHGSVSGKIEAINLHDQSRNFRIYPIIGASRVQGTFRSRDRKLFANAVDRYVTVFGRLQYKKWDRYPHAIRAESIEIHDTSDLPTLDSLKGIAPQATGSLTSQEFVDGLSNEW